MHDVLRILSDLSECENQPLDDARLICEERDRPSVSASWAEDERRQLACEPTVKLHRLASIDLDKLRSVRTADGPQSSRSESLAGCGYEDRVDVQYKCMTCGKAFNRKCGLAKHRLVHASESHYKCALCDQMFHTGLLLTQHEQIHAGMQVFECITCGRAFSESKSLERHESTHVGEKRFECSTCCQTFERRANLITHDCMYSAKDASKSGQVFIKNKLMKHHPQQHGTGTLKKDRRLLKTSRTRTHLEKQVFTCLTCGQTFNSSSKKEKHIRTHTGERPYECSVCGKTFRVKENFVDHRRIHTGERIFECFICKKTFSYRCNLMKHCHDFHDGKKTDRGRSINLKKIQCVTCGRNFTAYRALREHERTHTGEQPFKCGDCGRVFNAMRNLIRHWRIHTGNKPFKCVTCGREFREKRHLKRHEVSFTHGQVAS